MPINRKRIRREIAINGAKVWITADTEQQYAEKIARLSGNKSTSERRIVFKDYADKWFSVFSKPNIENVTAATYRRQLTLHIFPFIGDKFIDEISVADVQTIFNSFGSCAKQETKNKTKTVLNQIFKMAVEERIIAFNPLQSTTLRINGLSSLPTEPYSVSDMRYFVSNLDRITNPEDKAWLAISLSLPLRAEEVLGIRWQDVDEENRILKIRGTVSHPLRNQGEFHLYTKTNSSRRELKFHKGLISYLPERTHDLDFVIGGRTAVSYMKLKRMRERIAKQIGYNGSITPRRFRTTVATDISDSTHDLKLVQQMLGHATPQMTLKHYDKGRKTSADASYAIEQCYGF